MSSLGRIRGRARRLSQRGALGMLTLMFILIIVFFAMSQALGISASNINDSSRHADSVEALFLAESAIEHVGHRFLSSGAPPTCDDATVGVGEADVALGRGVFRVLGAYNTKFDGTTPLGTSDLCRVRVQGQITGTNVRRTIDTLVGTTTDSISISSLNPNFNNNPFTGSRKDDDVNLPLQWETLTGGTQGLVYIGWDKNGGPDGSRAAFARKTKAGGTAASTGGAFSTTGTISITGPKTLRLTFDFRVWTSGSTSQEFYFSPVLWFDTDADNVADLAVYASGNSGGACAAGSAIGMCESGNTASTQPRSSGPIDDGCGYVDTACFESGPTDGTCPTYNPAAAGGCTMVDGTTTKCGTNAQCSSYVPPSGSTAYETGYLTYVLAFNGTANLKSISFSADGLEPKGRFRGKDGQVTWIWVDNLRLSVPSLSNTGPSKMWREVAAP